MTITYRTQLSTSTQRDSWLEINLSALERNYKKLSEKIKVNIMAVVKADAYGHGATTIAPVLQSLKIHSFGVATVDEGIALRNSGIKVPILILGATPFWSYESCCSNQLTITIYSCEQLNQLEDFCKNKNYIVPVQLKIDTGMNRLGISPSEVTKTLLKITSSKYFILEGIFSHLSDAKNIEFSKLQKDKFDNALKACPGMPLQKHIANSYAGINYPDFSYNLVRFGIALYGYEDDFLEPILSVKGRITHLHKVNKNDYVSYDRTWQAQKESIIATIPIGYADGIDRNLSNKIVGIYNGRQIKQVGTITMDQMMFDVSEIGNPKTGDIITLIGKEVSIDSWAKILNTITFELVCKLKLRLPRIYTRD